MATRKGKLALVKLGLLRGGRGRGGAGNQSHQTVAAATWISHWQLREAVATRKGRGKIALVKLGLLRGGRGRGGAGDAVAWVQATCLGMVRGPG